MISKIKLQKFSVLILNLCLTAFLSSNYAPAQVKKTGATARKLNSVNQPKAAVISNGNVKQPGKFFNVNLIKNGGAETGSGADWTNADQLKTFRYDGGWGDAWQVTPPNHGDSYFYSGVSLEKPSQAFSQDLDVSEIAKEIDANRVGYNSGAWFGVRGMAAGRLKIEFYDQNKVLINRPADADSTEKITLANKPDDVTMVGKNRAGDVSAGTRKIKVTLEFYLFEDTPKDNNGESPFTDNLSLFLTDRGDK